MQQELTPPATTFGLRIQVPTHDNHFQRMLYPPQTSPTDEYSPTDAREMAPFLRNLRNMLEMESPEVLRWNKDGSAFEIHNMDELTHTILPKYFKHNKYTSFQRQLNYFHFKKWTKSRANVCTFSNDFFLRDDPDKSLWITRKKALGGSRSASFDESVPTPRTAAVMVAEGFDPCDPRRPTPQEFLMKDDLEWLANLETVPLSNVKGDSAALDWIQPTPYPDAAYPDTWVVNV
ncbi:hypothetical protein H310_10216 [Aphanomyces invadans]|uniref:HSF-type DNA-binding domain-containing protein n=1 Tax=Aphanomyces invadans TaxID=157072 RepID=A0A024TQS4_9STRA|nr:hypothetical protein H310_10216 [Aphanomyces invadans]ETV96485.1 hypothetical protein H310_10216 [Aphanomyces invadans]|eukprot:XP_008874748.1 hypothetical protein H310_10216 [Aphanomyces invadans]